MRSSQIDTSSPKDSKSVKGCENALDSDSREECGIHTHSISQQVSSECSVRNEIALRFSSVVVSPCGKYSPSFGRLVKMGCADRLRDIWSRVQSTSHRGRYSIQRLCELQEYSQLNPLWRVLLVLLLALLPSQLVIVCLNVVPLQDPCAG